jgi:hypothetical protein
MIDNRQPDPLTVNVRSTDAADVAVDRLLSVPPSARRVVIPHHEYKDISVNLRKPKDNKIREVSLDIRHSTDPEIHASPMFMLIPDADLLLPKPVIKCGVAVVTAEARQEVPGGVDRDPQAPQLGLPFKSGALAFRSNPRGTEALVELGSTCTTTTPDLVSASLSITLQGHTKTVGSATWHTWAKLDPQWSASLALPGDPSRHQWEVEVTPTVPAEDGYKCRVLVDAEVKENVPSRTIQRFKPLEPGEHVVSLTCPTAPEWLTYEHHLLWSVKVNVSRINKTRQTL